MRWITPQKAHLIHPTVTKEIMNEGNKMNSPDKETTFITIEGIEGSGKSSALLFIQDYLTTQAKNFIVTREPGGTQLAEAIRQLLLLPTLDEKMLGETELLLMFACRTQHIAHVILPALQAGRIVVCDRFIDATFAYQGAGRLMDISHIKMLESWLMPNLVPSLTLLLDVPTEVGLARAKHRGPQDRIERETLEFHERVRQGYLQRAEQEPKRFRVVDANQPLPAVQKALHTILNEFYA